MPAQVPGMLRQGGTYYVVGYGERVDIPNWDFVIREINVVGNLVGNYMDLVELMNLAARGKVTLHTWLGNGTSSMRFTVLPGL